MLDDAGPSRAAESVVFIERLRAICTCLEEAHTTRSAVAVVPSGCVGEGRWTLVDCFRHRAGLFVVARLDPLSVPSKDAPVLTARERSIVQQVARGEGLKSVADACSLSIQAVSTYLVRAKRKLRAASRAELARFVLADADDSDDARFREALPSPPATRPPPKTWPWPDLCLDAELRLEDRWFRFLRGLALDRRNGVGALTQSELEVLLAVVRGLKNAEIARERRRSVRTVDTQVSSVLRKCGAASRAELVAALVAAQSAAASGPRASL